MTIEDDLNRQLRLWADDLAAQVSAYHLPDALYRPQEDRRRSKWYAATAAMLVFATIAGGLWLRRNQDSSLSNGDVEVYYERVEVIVAAQYECSDPKPGVPNRATVETWEDLANKRYRSSVTYPDGVVVDSISIGGPYYPSEKYVRGQSPEAAFGCDNPSVVMGRVDGGALNVRTERPFHANGDPLVLRARDTATPVEGDFTDSLGRAAKLLREVHTGGFSPDRPRDTSELLSLRQTTSVYIDPNTDDVLEKVFINTIDTLGTVTSRSTLIDQGTRLVSPALFDHAGYEPVAVLQKPTDSRPPASTAAGPATR